MQYWGNIIGFVPNHGQCFVHAKTYGKKWEYF